ncbi:MAG: LPS assembly lipoprotein LptE [Devosia sp.]
MWWSEARRSLLVLTLVLAPVLSACAGFTPVYGPSGIASREVPLAYAAPANRLEQIIYQDLALRLGKASGPAPTLDVDVTQASRDLTANDTLTLPATQQQMVVTAKIRLTDLNGKTLFSGSRSASADYTANSQGFASREAADDAARRAAKSLADTIRLTILGALAQ